MLKVHSLGHHGEICCNGFMIMLVKEREEKEKNALDVFRAPSEWL